MGTSTVSGPFRSENGFQELVNGQWVPVAGSGGGGGPVCTQYMTIANTFACYSYDTGWIVSNPAEYIKLYQPSAPGIVRVQYAPEVAFDQFYGFRSHAIQLPDTTSTVVQNFLFGPTTVQSEYFGDSSNVPPIPPQPDCSTGFASYYNNDQFEDPPTIYLSRTQDPFISVDFCFWGLLVGPPESPFAGFCVGIWRQITPIQVDFCGGYLNPRINPVCQY